MPVSSWAFVMPFQLSLQLEQFFSPLEVSCFILRLYFLFFLIFFTHQRIIQNFIQVMEQPFWLVFCGLGCSFYKIHSSCKFCITWDFACSLESHYKRLYLGFLVCFATFSFFPLFPLSPSLFSLEKTQAYFCIKEVIWHSFRN